MRRWSVVLASAAALCAALAWPLRAEPPIFPEQRHIEYRPGFAFPRYRLPTIATPPTVTRKMENLEPLYLSLDDVIRATLANADVIRILAGSGAAASGRTIYDPAIQNTLIDQQTGRFDPALTLDNIFSQTDIPSAGFDPLNPGSAVINGLKTETYRFNTNISQQNTLGGTAALGYNTNPQRFSPGIFPLDPQNRSALELSYTQPLLQGAGRAANLAPILVARINTERSFYQLKDTVQEQVRSAIEGYWSLVFARVDEWVRRQQVEQTEEALRVAEGRFTAEVADIAEVTQARTSLANFRATLIGAQANVLQREAALRNLMGLPPSDCRQIIPVTPPQTDPFCSDWDLLCELAADCRPDLMDLQLALDADLKQLAQANNTALPRTDAQLLYRANGLSGTDPGGTRRSAGLGGFDDWTVGVNVTVPLGLRQARAARRQQELIVMRDRANLHQGLHNAVHLLATNVRNIDLAYEQYLAFTEARKAARLNLERQIALYRNGRTIYLNVLVAITDWGNTVSAEAGSLTQFNSQLASLERQTGTILETHGVYFFEEQFASTGPLGRLFPDRCYPAALHADTCTVRYPVSDKPSDESFDLEQPSSPDVDSPLPDLPYRELLQPLPPPDEPMPALPDLLPVPHGSAKRLPDDGL